MSYSISLDLADHEKIAVKVAAAKAEKSAKEWVKEAIMEKLNQEQEE